MVFPVENCLSPILEKVCVRDLGAKNHHIFLKNHSVAGGSEGRDHSDTETRSTREREAAMGIATPWGNFWNPWVISFAMRSHTADFPVG